MKKKTMLHGVAVAAVLASGLMVADAAYASDAECVPSEGTQAELGGWARTSFTAWQPADTPPLDPDGQSGDNNPRNLKQIGEREQSVPGTAVVEITDWVRSMPTGDGWSVKATKVVTDKKAYDETVSNAVNQWYHWNGGNQLTPPAPPPAAGWGTDNGNHNGLMNKSDYAPNKVFDASKLGGKEASWFFHGLQGAVIKHHDAVTHVEYIYERQVEAQDVLYRWSVEERTYTAGTDPVTCDDEEQPPTDTPDTNTPAVPTEVLGETAQTPSSAPSAQNQPTQSHATGHDAPAVPLSIDAGL